MDILPALEVINIGGVGAQKGSGTVFHLYGVGSCLGVILYDAINQVGGVIYAMLPTSESSSSKTLSPFAFVDTGIESLIHHLVADFGASKAHLKAVLTGGANMQSTQNIFRIGEKNVEIAKEILKKEKLVLLLEDIGGSHNRSVRLDVGEAYVQISSPVNNRQLSLA